MKNLEMAKQPYEVYQDGDEWVVESWDIPDGAPLWAKFIGTHAEKRARQYAAAKNMNIK